ncbi:MAG: VCBS repeat-containing protein [Planctomycetes bacterium]|nr:VCBS repeat-containing protein [Planctomycetota bacterium]
MTTRNHRQNATPLSRGAPRSSRFAAFALSLAALQGAALAQFNNQWVEFVKDNSHLGPSPTAISNMTTSLPGDTAGSEFLGIETDFAVGDLNQDGWDDLVVVRKQPFTSTGRRTNMLLMNEKGILVDRTAQYASSSDIPGDQGFLALTNDRDAVIVDVDLDGWLDVVTATTLSDGLPKSIGHPRVYMNRGKDLSGNWLGLFHQDARIPQLYQYITGNPENPRFCAVAAGDVTGDGYPDLYFGDYDSGGAGGPAEPTDKDLNDRLLINRGAIQPGYFVDESQLRMTATMLASAFSMAAEIVDLNLDGTLDIVKDTALQSPQYVAVAYNNPANEGFFNIFDDTDNGSSSPYHIAVGDLNNDGRPDIITSDDGLDRYRFNLATDPLGRVQFSGGSGGNTYEFLTGGDDGFASENFIADLDGDGWKDTLHCDVDVDIPGYSRRLHIYHNLGGAPGSQITLRHERQTSGSGGWLGAKGLYEGDLTGTHDLGILDLDNDNDLDLLISRGAGTNVWINQTDPVTCAQDLGYQGPGSATLSVCGQPLWTGNSATFLLQNAKPSAPAWIFVSLFANPAPFVGGMLVPLPLVIPPVVLFTDPAGQMVFPVAGGSGPIDVVLQIAVVDASQPQGAALSNAVKISFYP